MLIFFVLLAAGAIFVLAKIAVVDWQTFKIRNTDILILLGLAIALGAVRLVVPLESPMEAGARVAVALIVFGLLFALWMTGGFGAGDAKLVPVCVLLVAASSWLWFAAGLVLSTLAILLAVRLLPANSVSAAAAAKGATTKDSKVLPYGTVIAPPTILAMLQELYFVLFSTGRGLLDQL